MSVVGWARLEDTYASSKKQILSCPPLPPSSAVPPLLAMYNRKIAKAFPNKQTNKCATYFVAQKKTTEASCGIYFDAHSICTCTHGVHCLNNNNARVLSSINRFIQAMYLQEHFRLQTHHTNAYEWKRHPEEKQFVLLEIWY